MTKILLVEDDKSLREIYGVRLYAEGYDIVSAGDGEQALAMAIKERPQLIISDVMMPKISGFDMLDILRSTTETKGIKVIIMTALSSEDQRTRGEGLGADRYLVKSQVGIEDVVRTVHEVLGDAPVTSSTPNQLFGNPTPSAVPRQAPPVAPRPATAAPQSPSSAAVPQQAQPTPAPATQQSSPTPAPASPEQTGLPQPTAPFSTARPANLGDRVIHPITQSEAAPDFSHLMDQELSGASSTQAPTPPTPQAMPTSTPAPTPELHFEETPLPPAPQPPSPFGPQTPQSPESPQQ